MYSKKYYLGTSDVDAFLELKISSMFVMFQDVATEHAEMLGIGKTQTIDKGQFWVISRYAVNIIKMPRYLDTVVVKTYPGDDLRFIFPRYFQIEDEKGNVLVRASSTWCVLNKDTHSVVMNPFDGMKLPTEHYDGEEPLPQKVSTDEVKVVDKRVVRYSDIDLNSHLNNTKYIDYFMDTKSLDFYKTHRIKHITINYEKEMLYGDEVTLMSNEKTNEYMVGFVNDKRIFEINIDYEKR